MAWKATLGIGLMTLSMCGCSGGTTPQNAAENAEPAVVADPPFDPTLAMPEHLAGMGDDGTSIPPTAPRAIRRMLKNVSDGQLQQAYDFLPPSYQADVDRVIHTFASRMDEEVWSELFVVLEKGVRVLREQKDLILGLMKQPGREEDLQQLADNWSGMVDSLELLVESDLSQLSRLKKISSREFLETTANPIFDELRTLSSVAGPNPIDRLKDMQVETVSESSELVVVSMTSPESSEPREVPFVRVDSRWIPRSLAQEWSASIASVEERLKSISPESMQASKPRLLETLAMVDQSFDQMLAADSGDQLQQAAFPLILQAMQVGALMRSPAGPADGVTLVISQELVDDQQSQLLKDLEHLTDDPKRSTYTATTGGGQTSITLRPVKDPTAFAAKLTFAKTKSVDVSSRTIRIELAE